MGFEKVDFMLNKLTRTSNGPEKLFSSRHNVLMYVVWIKFITKHKEKREREKKNCYKLMN